MNQSASKSSRIATFAVIGIVLFVMAIARSLEPDPKGYGTHQQLGLPPCSSILLLGVKCPACGMTTAWAYAMRGQLAEAWEANAGGLVLVAVAVVYMPIFAYFALRGRWTSRGQLSMSLAICLTCALLIALIQWL